MKMHKKILLADARYASLLERYWGSEYTILKSVKCAELPEPVSYHPDMVLFPLGYHSFLCAPNVYSAYQSLLAPYGIKLVQGKRFLSGNYPKDIAYNIASVGTFLFGNKKNADPKILEHARSSGHVFIDVRQGYAKCSTCIADESSIITADPSIRRAAEACGLSVLPIQQGHILLPGYEYGFIGGASGHSKTNTLLFAGDLSLHPDGAAISQFLSKRNIDIIEIPNQKLLDLGTIFSIDT